MWLLAILVRSSQHTQPVGTKQDVAPFDILCNAFSWWIVTSLDPQDEVFLEMWFNGRACGNTSPWEGIPHTYIPTRAQTAPWAHSHLVWSVERLHSFDCGSWIYFCSRNLWGPLFSVHLTWNRCVLHGSDKGAGGCGAPPWTAVARSDLLWRVPVLSGFWQLFCATFPVVLLAQWDVVVSLETLAGHLSNQGSPFLHAVPHGASGRAQGTKGDGKH